MGNYYYWNALTICMLACISFSLFGRMVLSVEDADRQPSLHGGNHLSTTSINEPAVPVHLPNNALVGNVLNGNVPQMDIFEKYFDAYDWRTFNLEGKSFVDSFSSLSLDYSSFLDNFKKSMAFTAQAGAVVELFDRFSASSHGVPLPRDYMEAYGNMQDAFTYGKGLTKTFAKSLSLEKVGAIDFNKFDSSFLKSSDFFGSMKEYVGMDEKRNEAGRRSGNGNRSSGIRGNFVKKSAANISTDLNKSIGSLGDRAKMQSIMKEDFFIDMDVLQSLQFNALKLSNVMHRQKIGSGAVSVMMSKKLDLDLFASAFGGLSLSKIVDLGVARKYNLDMDFIKNMDVSAGAYLHLLKQIDLGLYGAESLSDVNLISGVGIVPGLVDKVDAGSLLEFVAASDDFALRMNELTEVNMFNRANLFAAMSSSAKLRSHLVDLNALFRSEGHVNFAVVDLLAQVDQVVTDIDRFEELLSVTNRFPRKIRTVGSSFGIFGSVFSSFSAFADVRSLSNFGLFDFSASSGLLSNFRISDTFTWGDATKKLPQLLAGGPGLGVSGISGIAGDLSSGIGHGGLSGVGVASGLASGISAASGIASGIGMATDLATGLTAAQGLTAGLGASGGLASKIAGGGVTSGLASGLSGHAVVGGVLSKKGVGHAISDGIGGLGFAPDVLDGVPSVVGNLGGSGSIISQIDTGVGAGLGLGGSENLLGGISSSSGILGDVNGKLQEGLSGEGSIVGVNNILGDVSLPIGGLKSGLSGGLATGLKGGAGQILSNGLVPSLS